MSVFFTEPIFRIPLMLVALYGGNVVARDPNPTTSKEERQRYNFHEPIFEKIWPTEGMIFMIRRVRPTFYVYVTSFFPRVD